MLHLPALAALAFVPLFAFCDREVGDGEKGFVTRSVAMAIAIFVGGLLGYLTLGPWFALTGPLWAAWRSIGFADGELDPSTPKGITGCAFRYAMWVPISALLAYWSHGDVKLIAGPMAVAALVSLGLRFEFGQMTKEARANGTALKGDFNATIEKLTGALFGAALAAYAICQP